jgi:hypothetical protein
LPDHDSVHEVQEPFTLEVQAPTDFFNPFIDSQPTRRTKLLQHLPLVGYIRFLAGAGYAAIDNTLSAWALLACTAHLCPVFVCVLPSMGRCPVGHKPTHVIPAL